ncbi:hypothetical protein PR048_032122 [Dryococelus australis]|uniref:Uncharacterized protein n=1 Tax=Dryococelus australis TaxID=614101 RepID=A0ABQ9G5F3_9NEOP|nr:hypothetical protein PR048_032122 [Dryococelus australis]
MLVRSVREWKVLREELVSERGVVKFRKGVEKELVGGCTGEEGQTVESFRGYGSRGKGYGERVLGRNWRVKGAERRTFMPPGLHSGNVKELAVQSVLFARILSREVRELEKVQRKAARWVKGRWRRQGQGDEEEGNKRPSVTIKEMG